VSQGTQEKTEKATPKRRKKAREEGQVAKSRELTMALSLLLLLVFFLGTIPIGLGYFQQFLHYSLTADVTMELTEANLHRRAMEAARVAALIIIPMLSASALFGLAGELTQVGFLFTTKVLTPKPERLNPIKGLQRIFSKRAVVELLKAMLKAGMFIGVAYSILRDFIPVLLKIPHMAITDALSEVGMVIFQIGITIAIFHLIISVLDYAYQRWEHEKNIRMSKKDVRDEHKDTEGDPQIQSKIKERQRFMAQQRMMQEVPTANVVITNPTHLAIALRYDGEEMNAPQVVAKGSGEVAFKIVEIARANNVEVMEEKALAQALFHSTEIGEEIPPELYQAVAEILAFVFRLQKYYS